MMKKTLLLTTGLLAACSGYAPLLTTSSAGVSIAEVNMINPARNIGERRIAQGVRQNLLKSFTPQADAPYSLRVSIEEIETTLAIEEDATAERLRLVLTATTVLTAGEKPILQTELNADAAFNVEDSPFSTQSGRTFAREAAARTLSQVITQEVNLAIRAYENKLKTPTPAPASNENK